MPNVFTYCWVNSQTNATTWGPLYSSMGPVLEVVGAPGPGLYGVLIRFQDGEAKQDDLTFQGLLRLWYFGEAVEHSAVIRNALDAAMLAELAVWQGAPGNYPTIVQGYTRSPTEAERARAQAMQAAMQSTD